MDSVSYKTISANKATAQKGWVVIDAEGQVLGRLASIAAKFARGKFKTSYTPHVDCGDNVIIVNAEKVVLTGTKTDVKEYVRYTGYPGGQRFTTPRQLLDTAPERILEHAIYGMLPKTKLGRALNKNVYIYVGGSHPHEAQQPKVINLNEVK